jgi:hypothetical protein
MNLCVVCGQPAAFRCAHNSAPEAFCSARCSNLHCSTRCLLVGDQLSLNEVTDALSPLFGALRDSLQNLRYQDQPSLPDSPFQRYVDEQLATLGRLLRSKRDSPDPSPAGSPDRPKVEPHPAAGAGAWYGTLSAFSEAVAPSGAVYPPPAPTPDQSMSEYVSVAYLEQARPFSADMWDMLRKRMQTSTGVMEIAMGTEGKVLLFPDLDARFVLKVFFNSTPVKAFWQQVYFLLYNFYTGVVPRILMWAAPPGKSSYIAMERLPEQSLATCAIPFASYFDSKTGHPTTAWIQLLVGIVSARQRLVRHDRYRYHDVLNAGNLAVGPSPGEDIFGETGPQVVKFYEVGRVEERPASGGEDALFLRKCANFLLADWKTQKN